MPDNVSRRASNTLVKPAPLAPKRDVTPPVHDTWTNQIGSGPISEKPRNWSCRSPTPRTIDEEFANRLRPHRRAAGCRIREAAERLEIDRGYLSRIERGLRCPSPQVADRIAEVYRLPIGMSDRLMATAAHTRAYWRSIGVR